jgi:hypothetical protein
LLARSAWREQTFERTIEASRLQELRSRSAAATDRPQEKLREYSRTGTPEKLAIPVPGIVRGVIGHPGEVHTYKFNVDSGAQLAFELEATGVGPPQFNPLLTILDAEGHEVLNNVYLRIGRNPNYRKTVQPKVLHAFQRGGEFTAQVRDITAAYGSPQFGYKLLIRPQIPHVGEIEVTEHVDEPDGKQADYPIDRINISPGVPKKLRVSINVEEGLPDSFMVTMEGLPPGVQVLPASQTDPDATPPLDEGDKYRFLPKTSYAMIMLAARGDCPVTPMPVMTRLVVTTVQPDGTISRPLAVQPVPLVVVKRAEAISEREVFRATR